jgi:hypothetical protein
MSAAPKMCENPCETCAKEGLPLLLTRYALMPKETGAPTLTGQLQDPNLAKVSLGQGAHYGLRLLRSGYVYVYDEARKHFDEYFVTADGFMSKMPPRVWALKQQHKPATEFRCARNGSAPLAGVITIRNPKHATKVWIAFSNAEWTKALFDQHQDAAHRAKHMRCITITGGKVAPQPGTAPIEQLQQHVPEFKMGQASAAKAFAKWCPHQYNGRQLGAEPLLKAVRQARPQGGGAIVTLHDPTALAMEIASLMDLRKSNFMHHDSVAKPRFAATAIASLEHSVKEQAKLEELAAAQSVASDMVVNGGLANLLPSYQAMVTKVAKVTPGELQKVANDKWRQYTHDRTGKPRFDASRRQAWLDDYNKQFQKLDAEHIAPLAKAHVAWLKHRCMISHLSCNFDSADRESGIAYTATFVDLMKHTLDKQPSYDLYLKWLTAGDFSDDNLAMRALGFNQAELIDKLKQADAAPVDGRAFPSDAVASAIAAFMEKMPATANAQLTALLAGLSGPSLKYWSDFHAGKVGSKAAAAMAAVTGKQFVRLPITGNRGQFVQAYMRELYRLDPDMRTKPNQLQSAIAKQVQLLAIEGVKMNGHSKLGWYVLLDREVVAGATVKNLSGQALANELVQAIRTPQDIQKLDMARAARFRASAYGGATALTGMLMLLNYSKLLEDVEKGMSHELAEAKDKLTLGQVAIGGFVAEQLGGALEKVGETPLKNMAGRFGGYMPNILKLTGRFAGFGVGVLLGLWDISKGVDSGQQGDHGMAIAYLSSGTAAVVVSSVMFGMAMGALSLGPIGWIVLALGVLIWLGATLFIESSKDNKRQEWLSRCHFGTGADKYPDAQTHIEQYKLALAG